MEITTSVNIGGVLNALKMARTTPVQQARALKKAALGHVRDIKTRTADGEGLRGPFKGYSESYSEMLVERRFGKNKPKGGKDPLKVNLFYSGRMLANLGVVKVTPNFALVSFRSVIERKKAKANQRTRPFMGITRDEQKIIVKRFKRALFK